MDIGRRVPGSMLPRLRKIKVEIGLTRNRVNSYYGKTRLVGRLTKKSYCVEVPSHSSDHIE